MNGVNYRNVMHGILLATASRTTIGASRVTNLRAEAFPRGEWWIFRGPSNCKKRRAPIPSAALKVNYHRHRDVSIASIKQPAIHTVQSHSSYRYPCLNRSTNNEFLGTYTNNLYASYSSSPTYPPPYAYNRSARAVLPT